MADRMPLYNIGLFTLYKYCPTWQMKHNLSDDVTQDKILKADKMSREAWFGQKAALTESNTIIILVYL